MPPYRLIRPLVTHGRCTVFECERDDGKIFIFKQLSSNTTDVAAARFEREIRLASTVSHPNIVKVIDVEPGPKPTWFVMPKYECSLADRLTDIRGKPHIVNPIFTSLLRGVARLHWHAIVHRDLKPENVLVNLSRTSPATSSALEVPDLVVADFGISRDIASPKRLTMTGQALGTDFYMAPEIRTLGASQADCRSDIFALGGILGALYTGLPSSDRNDSGDGPTMPFEILRLVNKARSWMPDRRYQTVPALQRAWRLATLAPVVRALAADGQAAFGEQLRHDGAPTEDIDRIVTLVGRSVPTSQQVYDTITQVRSTTMGIVARRNPALARRLVWVFLDHVEADEGELLSGDAVVRCYEALSDDVDDPVCRGALAAALLTFGHRRDERRAISLFNTLVSCAADAQQLDPIRDALLECDPGRVMHAKHAVVQNGLTGATRELFASL